MRSHESEPFAKNLIPSLPAVVIVGAQGVGKSSLAGSLVKDQIRIQSSDSDRKFGGNVPLCYTFVS